MPLESFGDFFVEVICMEIKIHVLGKTVYTLFSCIFSYTFCRVIFYTQFFNSVYSPYYWNVIMSFCCSSLLKVQASDPYIRTGKTNVLYISSLVFLDSSFDLNIEPKPKRQRLARLILRVISSPVLLLLLTCVPKYTNSRTHSKLNRPKLTL